MKICVGLSGGVDSSVAAYLLKKAGYDVFALFMQNWHDTTGTLHGDCEWEEDRFVAEMVARKIGIPFYFVDLSEEYRKRVVDYMFDEYSKGRTPNPDVLCNREIKFDAFLKCAMKLGADCVATGHYCRKDVITGADGEPVYRIFAGSDPNKDQSYFLCQLTQEQLSRAMFPVGDLDKPEVRRIAKEADLPSADKKDSQGICFVGKVDLPTFLQQKLSPAEGNIVEVYDAYFQDNAQYGFIHDTLLSLKKDRESGDVRMITDYISETRSLKVNDPAHEYDAAGNPANEGGCSADSPFSSERIGSLTDEDLLRLSCPVTYDGIRFETETYRSGKKHIKKTRYKENPYGKIIGRHDGAQFYTIGQRKGLNVGGHKDSLFVISTDLKDNVIYVGEGHTHKGLSRSCLRIRPEDIHWIREDIPMESGELRRYRVRIRYRQPLQDATLVMRDSGLYILFDSPQRGITPGQFSVWYDHDEMVGSGVISC
ncbi:MAG: tRNA 2-thiouridine(34) synthase MnmA [Bacteroidetes bacterium]|uniref:tRNA-specific 2-thiouridylase MnmA n=1 Tax=Candidatus Cryptobacteroides faecavium TaxID=2840762 RepID=A0A9D9IEU3_9BACT|nr:tRNA 2-thiouridine(34) synthase MnmA [Candidatus Cryptobacteroides faecavium]